MSKFDKVMANLRESLRHATPDEDGQPSYCMVRKDELEALMMCASALRHVGKNEDAWFYEHPIIRLEACADE
jgi:hypothetical protein